KKEVARSRVRRVEIEFDSMRLASIFGVPGNNGICEYIKEVWEESKYIKPLEITRKFANNELLTATRRKIGEFAEIHDETHVICDFVKDHELPYGDWLTMVFEAFNVPLVDRQGEEPKRYDFFEETFLTMCQLKRESSVWWLGTGEHRRRDDEAEQVQNDAPAENEEMNQQDFDWEAVIDEVEIKEEEVREEAEVQGESGLGEKFLMLRMRFKGPRM
ncbi:hypothetical protein Dimus_028979, partial [Dionaea muscipula]